MKKQFSILPYITLLFIFTVKVTFAQIVICGNKQSFHPIDIRAFQLRDSLQHRGIDSIIVYRHWSTTNGYNGYGKIIWIDNGKCFQIKIILKTANELKEILQTKIFKLSSDSVFTFFFYNQIDTITANPTKQDIKMSHDAQHFAQISCGDKSHCFIIPGLLVQFNTDHLRAKYISMLADENVSSVNPYGKKRSSTQRD